VKEPRLQIDRKVLGRWSIRWDEARVQEAYAEGWWTHETLADAARRAASQTPNRIIVVDDTQHLDCIGLYDRAKALALAMLARGPAGSVISFMLPNWHEAAVIYLAATMAGMVVHPLLPNLRDRDIEIVLKDIDSRMLFVPARFRDFDYVSMIGRVAPGLVTCPEIVVLRGDPGPYLAYESLFNASPVELPSLDPDAVRMVLYTSGTTGKPKGVLHSHNSIHALIRQISLSWHIAPGDAFLVPSPIGHIGGSVYAFECPLLLGTSAVLMERWVPEDAVRIAREQRCTHIAGATPFLEQLLTAATQAGLKLPELKVFICGGASVPPSLIRRSAAYFENTAVTRVYGSTEVPITTIGAPDRADLAHAADTDGRPGIAHVKLVTPSGEAGHVGEICARGPQMLVGYVHPEDEEAVFDSEGFYRTGDLGRWVDERYLVVSGRVKDIIIRNGENIAPKEIEDLLAEHPEVLEVAIVGLPDHRTGERACAVIVPKSGAAPSLDDVRGFLRERGVAAFKIPEQVAVWDSLPKNAMGKGLKRDVSARLMEER
jgi:acyl-CoA synthetase (AMP-forming)/AMP-acid ligase II